jgi:CRISPR-associated protein Cas2
MAQRRRYLVAYDIREDGRLRRVHATVRSYGYPLQYSVFICDLTDAEKVAFKWEVGEVMDFGVDSVVLVDLGETTGRGADCFEFIGPHADLPGMGPNIV